MSQNLLDFLASFYKKTVTSFDCERTTTWLGNKLQVQFKSSTHLNSSITYLNFLACFFCHFFRFSSNSLSSRSMRTACHRNRYSLAASPRFGTPYNANFIKVEGFLTRGVSSSCSWGRGINGCLLYAVVKIVRKLKKQDYKELKDSKSSVLRTDTSF